MNHKHMGAVLFQSTIGILCKQAVAVCGGVGVEGALNAEAGNPGKVWVMKGKLTDDWFDSKKGYFEWSLSMKTRYFHVFLQNE